MQLRICQICGSVAAYPHWVHVFLYFLQVEALSKYDVVLTTYSLVANQYSAYASRELDIKASVDGQVSRKVQIGRDTCVRHSRDTQRP